MKNNYKKIILSIVVMLIFMGFTFPGNAQVGTNNLFCPAVPYTTGMLNVEITPFGDFPATFTAGMIGVFENIGNGIGDMDWMVTNGTRRLDVTVAPTNEIGGQLISWWTRTDGRNTQFQVTNHGDGSGTHTSEGLTVHIHIYNSECVEVRDFCDTFTPLDTHVYDLSNLVTNTGLDISEVSLEGQEGILIITPVDECHVASLEEQAIEHNFLSGNVYISDNLGNVGGNDLVYAYGTNMFARRAICVEPFCVDQKLDGSAKARFDTIVPDQIFGLFHTAHSNGGSDAVVMSFFDDYGPPYLPRMTYSRYSVSIFDNNENEQTCGEVEACFLRYGIDTTMPARQDFTLP